MLALHVQPYVSFGQHDSSRDFKPPVRYARTSIRRGLFTHSMPYPCRAHPFRLPCRAVPLKVYNVSFPFDLHSAAVSDSHLPCHAHAMLRPCRSSQGHGTACPSRDGLWAICPLSASSGYHAEFHEGCYQKHNNFRCRWPV